MWVAVTVSSIVLSWYGVGLVVDQIVTRPSPALAADAGATAGTVPARPAGAGGGPGVGGQRR